MINFPKLTEKIAISFAVLSLVIFYFATYLYVTITKHKSIPPTALPSEFKKTVRYLPAHLQIPSINVDATVEHVGVTSDEEMAVPGDIRNAGWYELGTSPGEKGSAVISGHFNGKDGKPGLFKDLSDLKPGDMIYVINDLGIISNFKVKESRTYYPGYAEEIFSPKDSGTHLNLITCDGLWDAAKRSFTKRLVVFADISI